METQRVNTYRSDSGVQVFFIEQYNPALRDWFTVGDTYEVYLHAESIVINHNLKQLLSTIGR